MQRAAIIGLSGPDLTLEEARLLRSQRPLGVILFARNVQSPDQLRRLTSSIREELGAEAHILVDQEGGRVARLRPPHFPEFPAAATFEALAPEVAEANATLLAAECVAVGFDVICAPVLDLRVKGAHDIVGDRAFSEDPGRVAALGGAWIAGMQAAGAVPVIKHIPGHGRALADSHYELPYIELGHSDLQSDLVPFAAVAGMGAWAMTAHILYSSWDRQRPATLSPFIIEEIIRKEVGFDGVLLSDDLAMRALKGTPGDLAAAVLAAGCDVALHCTGVLEESRAVLLHAAAVSDQTWQRLADARAAVRSRQGQQQPDLTALLALRDAAMRSQA
ncbi:beta-N-acetylhexosaminidase [Pseudoroseomonas globiformis]|uniref:beta-N-acetylhexosaminidase n=1 Tax=Teichococcus globiformis TaxID=2307229 RepID=A0ABV7G1C1_9PROT